MCCLCFAMIRGKFQNASLDFFILVYWGQYFPLSSFIGCYKLNCRIKFSKGIFMSIRSSELSYPGHRSAYLGLSCPHCWDNFTIKNFIPSGCLKSSIIIPQQLDLDSSLAPFERKLILVFFLLQHPSYQGRPCKLPNIIYCRPRMSAKLTIQAVPIVVRSGKLLSHPPLYTWPWFLKDFSTALTMTFSLDWE